MNIRRANEKDIEVLIELRLAFLNQSYEMDDKQIALIKKQLEDYYTSHINSDFVAYIAEETGKAGETDKAEEMKKVVSTAFMVIQERPANPYFITGKTGLFLNVYTYPDYRRQGIATKILKELIKAAERENLSFIELSATEEGRPVYEKLGFVAKTSDNTEMRLNFL